MLALLPPDTPIPAPPVDPTGDAPIRTFQLDGATGDVWAVYDLGPAAGDGADLIESATAEADSFGTWSVYPVLTDTGIDAFNEMAAACFAKEQTCPSGQAAVVVDGVVISAPTIQTPSFDADQLQISGDFDETEARELAARLDDGSS